MRMWTSCSVPQHRPSITMMTSSSVVIPTTVDTDIINEDLGSLDDLLSQVVAHEAEDDVESDE